MFLTEKTKTDLEQTLVLTHILVLPFQQSNAHGGNRLGVYAVGNICMEMLLCRVYKAAWVDVCTGQRVFFCVFCRHKASAPITSGK